MKLNLKIKNHGITLISLVVTIIILLILAGISIALISGSNGILDRASGAVDTNDQATATEKMEMKITYFNIRSYGENTRKANLQELAEGMFQDKEVDYVKIKENKVASLETINVEGENSIFVKLKEYPYEFEIGSDLQLASVDGVKLATPDTSNHELRTTIQELKEEIQALKNASYNYCTTPAGTTSSASSSEPCVVIENYRNGTEWYRVWSDGWIEQGGQSRAGGSSSGVKTTFLKEFSDTNYTISTTVFSDGSNANAVHYLRLRYKEKNGVNFDSGWVSSTSGGWYSYSFSWYACGY